MIQELTGVSYVGCNGATITDRVFTKAIQHDDYSKLMPGSYAHNILLPFLRIQFGCLNITKAD